MGSVQIITATYQEARILKGMNPNISGIGKEKAYKKAKYLISKGASFIISFGTAAALDPKVKAGSIIIPKEIVTSKRSKLYVDLEWHERIIKKLSNNYPVFHNPLLEVDSVIMDSWQRKKLYMEAGCIAADMESASILKAAIEAGISFLCIRAVSDSYGVKIPKWAVESIKDSGELSYLSFVKGLLYHPFDVLNIIKLFIGFYKAKQALRYIMGRIYPSLPL